MDMREASAMTEASGLPSDQDGFETAFEAKSGVSDGMRGSAEVREARAPLPSLLMAFLLGVLVASRR
jgi:hypothetical protein